MAKYEIAMSYRPFYTLVFLIVYLLLSTHSAAQIAAEKITGINAGSIVDNNPENKTDNGEKTTQDQLKVKQQQLQQQLNDNEKQQIQLSKDSALDKEQLKSSQQELESATAAYVTDKSETNQAKLKNARFKSVLAKRKTKKYDTQRGKLAQQATSLKQELSAIKAQLDDLVALNPSTTPDESSSTEETGTSSAAKSSTQEKKLSPEETAAEIARLSALLNNNRDNNQEQNTTVESTDPETTDTVTTDTATTDTATTDAIAKKTDSTKTTQLTDSNTLSILTAVSDNGDENTSSTSSDTESTQASSSNAPTPTSEYSNLSDVNASSEGTSNIRFLNSKSQVDKNEKILQALLKTRSFSRSSYNKMIIVKHIAEKSSDGGSTNYPLRALGHDQYRTEVELLSGENLLIIGFNRWRINIPENLREDKFIILMNNSNSQLPELVFYSKNLQ